uniref:NADH-ubiquinone oxidoreductase chain 3 n=1 Tax=Rhagophthalminae sp. GENSP01 TaxID=1205577 RepID=A0A0S2MNU3_9COLE|nr:NADH deshydrogenase subunit 3 [Rhagophthalminae sp. GENSP01]
MMLILMMLMFITLIVSATFMALTMFISKKTNNDREKNSPFECGFDPLMSARIPFSIHFFLIAVIFLIFDVEITLIIPIIISMKTTNTKMFFLISFLFLFILLIGLYHEWNQETFSWSN